MSKVVESFNPASTISAYRCVYANGTENTVAIATAASDVLIGVSEDTVVDTNQGLPVVTHGRALLEFNDSVTSGTWVQAGSAGKGVPVAGVTTTGDHHVIGVLLGATVQTTGTIAEIYVNPHVVDMND